MKRWMLRKRRTVEPGGQAVRDITEKKLIEAVKYTRQKRELPTSKPVAQYIRQSTLTQVRRNKISKEIQQDSWLRDRLISMGWLDNDAMIRKIDMDKGKSGQKRRDERMGLDRVYTMAEHGEIGAIAAFDASRLYRDLTRVYYTDFVHMCEEYGIVVITMETEYFPDSKQEMDALIEKFKEAAHQLDQIYLKANPARLLAVQEHVSYGGHCVPPGYIVIGEKGERRHYAVYEPHARLVRWLHKRLQELEGNVNRLFRELHTTGFVFPPFAGVKEIPHLALDFVEGVGYPIKTRQGLINLLINPAYVGLYCFNDTVVSRDAHPAIISPTDLAFARTRLAATDLNGSPNENKPPVNRRYKLGKNALLENVLTNDGTPVYAMAGRGVYVARKYDSGIQSSELVLPIKQLDKDFSTCIRVLLAELERLHKQGLEDDLHQKLLDAQIEKAEQEDTYTKDLAKIDKGIREATLDKKVALEEEYEPGVREATKRLKRLHADKEALEAKRQQADSEQEGLKECLSLLDLALTGWDKLKFGIKRRFIQLMVKTVNVREIAPHIVEMVIELRPPFAYSLECRIYRHRGSKPPWTDMETATLKRLYPTSDRLDILQALPRRTWESIVQQCGLMKLRRNTTLNTSGIHEALTWRDAQLMREKNMNTAVTPWTEEGESEEPLLQIGDQSVPLSEVLTNKELLNKSGLGPVGEPEPAPEPDLSELPEQAPPPEPEEEHPTRDGWTCRVGVITKRAIPVPTTDKDGSCSASTGESCRAGPAKQWG